MSLFGVLGQGEIATTATESTIPIDTHDDISDNNDDIDMILFDWDDDDNDITTTCMPLLR